LPHARRNQLRDSPKVSDTSATLRQLKESVLAKFIDYADLTNSCCRLDDLKRDNKAADGIGGHSRGAA